MPIFEQPPETLPQDLKEYLARLILIINYDTGNANQIPRLTALPDKISEGKIYYFKNAIPAHGVITLPGYYGVIGSTWVIIAQ